MRFLRSWKLSWSVFHTMEAQLEHQGQHTRSNARFIVEQSYSSLAPPIATRLPLSKDSALSTPTSMSEKGSNSIVVPGLILSCFARLLAAVVATLPADVASYVRGLYGLESLCRICSIPGLHVLLLRRGGDDGSGDPGTAAAYMRALLEKFATNSTLLNAILLINAHGRSRRGAEGVGESAKTYKLASMAGPALGKGVRTGSAPADTDTSGPPDGLKAALASIDYRSVRGLAKLNQCPANLYHRSWRDVAMLLTYFTASRPVNHAPTSMSPSRP